ncbi:hypothetical protein EJB05_08883, partial [Eragrostis curvula]
MAAGSTMADQREKELDELMKGMKLSDAERSGIKLLNRSQRTDDNKKWHAVAKVFTDKHINPEAITQPLGRIWCPSKGLICRELGDNKFLIQFGDPEGKVRGMEDGPWFVGHSHDLIVVVEYDEGKLVEEVEFHHIPIWIRVTKIPMGLMDRDTGVAIGDKIGQCLEVDEASNGPFLRIKVQLDIRVPILRGVMLEVDEKRHGRWCPLEYEFLPEFCHLCGIIGHIDKNCQTGNWRSKERPYNAKLRILPGRRMGTDASSNHSPSSENRWKGNKRRRSDISNWRSRAINKVNVNQGAMEDREKKDSESKSKEKEPEKENELGQKIQQVGENAVHVNSEKHGMHVSGEKALAIVPREEQQKKDNIEGSGKLRTFKRFPRNLDKNISECTTAKATQMKRSRGAEMEKEDAQNRKRQKEDGVEVLQPLVDSGMDVDMTQVQPKSARSKEDSAATSTPLVGAQGEPHQEQ